VSASRSTQRLDRSSVAKARLGLDPKWPIETIERRVPRPVVAERERDLRS
jgi:hypothetical protein